MDSGVLQQRLRERYSERHEIQGNSALYAYTQDLKRRHMKSAPPIQRVRYSDKIATVHRALGLHTYRVKVQGAKLKRDNQIEIGGLFKRLDPAFLRMVVVHELAHLRHKEHDRAFYRLCQHMEPDYAQLEFDLRLWLWMESLEA